MNFDDELLARQNALALLSENQEVEDYGYDEDEEVFGEDDLDRADNVMRRVHSADSLMQKSVLRQDIWGELHKIAPFARINPPSVLKGAIGGQQVVAAGKQIQVANWAGDDAETLPITVTIAPVQQELSSTQVYFPYAIVQFGTRGFLVKAEVDIVRGCQFTVSASAITVQVAMPQFSDTSRYIIPPVSTASVVDNSVMKLAGMLSFYPIVRTAPITRTLFSEAIPTTATSDFIPVPAFAKSVQVYYNTYGSDPSVFGGFSLVGVGDIGSSVFTTFQRNYSTFMDAPLILPNGTGAIAIINNSADTWTYSIVFELAL